MNRNRLAWGALLATVGAALLSGVEPAAAADLSFATTCIPPAGVGLGTVHGTSIADLTSSSSSPKVGDTVTVTWTTVKAASNNPGIIDLQPNTVKPSGTITVGGAQSGSVAVSGPMTNPAIPKNSPMVISAMTGTLKLTKAGQVTLSPAAYTITVLGTDTKCTADSPKVGLTLTVAAGSGSSSGGSTASSSPSSTTSTTGSTSTTGGSSSSSSSSGSTGSSSTGDLASTGGDSGTFQALGLLGGSILLVGAAVFVLTPWRRLRRSR
ncbi:hypothetical protein ABUW04_08770 [Streptacidiphilus sp. N1-10]|uniref:LPXTG cell wall anchor domain-containing protein n=1 Tax=Streptacidiphilus jeojiensis TaxID=3229225 RepID=A0ABV6XJB7_9ACTN